MLSKTLLLLLLISCSHRNDPLKNSRKLINDGHATLYNNGAFQIPTTKIKLIPAAPEPLELAKELSGVKARESFFKYLNEVQSSVVTVWEGGKKTYHFSKKVDRNVSHTLSTVGRSLSKNSSLVLSNSFAVSKEIVGKIFKSAKNHSSEVKKSGIEVKRKLYTKYKIELPKLEHPSERGKSLVEFSSYFAEAEKFRKRASRETVYLIGDSFRSYEDNVSKSFSRSKSEVSNADMTYGPSLAIVKSLYWILDGFLWEGTIVPLGKLSAGAVGYALVNGVAYPVILLSKGAVTQASVAVELLQDAALKTYEVSAPSLEIALSAILTSTSSVTGFAVGNTLEYVASPLVYGTEALVGTVGGVAVGVTGTTLAGVSKSSGEVLGVTAKTIGKVAQGTTIIAGTGIYAIKGTAEFAYEITKSAVVPPSLVLGSGLALSYGTVAQLSAQSVLAAADAAYLVLSLEGPKWVVYAVSGKLNEDPNSGDVLDLELMRKNGEEIRKVPVSDEELKKVLKSLES